MGWQPRRAGMATQRDVSSALRCHAGDSGADCLVGRASLRADPTPYNSPGGDGGEAEGRTPFAALSADARGGLKARSAFRQRTPPARHPICTRHEQAPCPCLRSACHRLSPAPSAPRDASAGSCSRAIRSGAAWRPCACELGPAAAARGTAAARPPASVLCYPPASGGVGISVIRAFPTNE